MAKKTQRNLIEAYFEWWLNELKDAGFIKHWDREFETLQVASTVQYGRIKRFKVKDNIVEKFNLFQSMSYTYDYRIFWDKTAEYHFFEEVNSSEVFQFGIPLFIAHNIKDDIVSYCDVKPTNSVVTRGGKVSSAVTFVYKQRLLWENKKIYINKVVPIPMAGTGHKSALFIKSFTPKRYLFTDGGKQIRKIRFPIVTVEEYLVKSTNRIKELLRKK